MSLLPQLERLLGDAAERLPANPSAASGNGHLSAAIATRQRRWHGLRGRPTRPLLVAAATLALGGAAGALAATGVFQTGTPVTTQPGHPPISTVGEGTARPGTIRVVSVRVADPAGGPAWGIGVFMTTTGLACPVTGRVVEGRLGVLGIDYAFHDDGRFHPLLAPASIGLDCAAPDAHGRLFLTGQAWIASASGDLAPEAAVSQRPHCDLPGTVEWHVRCPQTTLRTVYYGFLGPKARTISYTYRGQHHVQATSGSNGAYLVVLRAPPGSTKGRNARIGGFKAGPTLYATYSTGRTCDVHSVIELTHPTACQLVGYIQPQIRLPTPGQAHAAVRVRFVPELIDDNVPVHAPGIQVTFQAPVAITTTRSFYLVELHRPATRACDRALARAKTSSPLTQASQETLHAGQTLTIGTPLRPFCPGRYTGRLAYAVVTSPLSAADEIPPPVNSSHTVTAATFAIDIAAHDDTHAT
jgi:hypothetical protein